MKYLMLTSLLLINSLVFAQNNCEAFVPVEEGTKWELSHYSPKDKITGYTRYELLKKTTNASTTKFLIRSVSLDKKNKETFNTEYEAVCDNGQFEFDMSFMLQGGMMDAYQGMDLDVNASKLMMPSMNDPVGKSLGDGTITISFGQAGMSIMNFSIECKDRKIDAKETIETTAGKFESIKISQNVVMNTIIKMQFKTVEWFAPNVGMIRSESYDKNGKPNGYSVLSKLTKP